MLVSRWWFWWVPDAVVKSPRRWVFRFWRYGESYQKGWDKRVPIGERKVQRAWFHWHCVGRVRAHPWVPNMASFRVPLQDGAVVGERSCDASTDAESCPDCKGARPVFVRPSYLEMEL